MTTGQQQSVINNKSQMEKRANPILNGPSMYKILFYSFLKKIVDLLRL